MLQAPRTLPKLDLASIALLPAWFSFQVSLFLLKGAEGVHRFWWLGEKVGKQAVPLPLAAVRAGVLTYCHGVAGCKCLTHMHVHELLPHSVDPLN